MSSFRGYRPQSRAPILEHRPSSQKAVGTVSHKRSDGAYEGANGHCAIGDRPAMGMLTMNQEAMMSVAYLLERAAQCRHLALQARSGGIATELEKLAIDYDKDAARLEAFAPYRMRAAAAQ